MTTVLVAALAIQAANSLTPAEEKAGWKLLFDGKSTAGWHNFKATGVKPGWKIVDGALISQEPENAGDIVTDGKYDWFELSIDFKLTPNGNSGIMFRVADEGEATWHSGPEFQIFDHGSYPNAQRSGWLYQMYQSPVDATKPVGEWNTFRVVIDPRKCEAFMNGTKYFEFVIDSEDFKSRIGKTKFVEFPGFAKTVKGRIAIQGDHGIVSFRNMKIREIKPTAAATRAG